MKDRIKNALTEYEKKFSKTRKGLFYPSDIMDTINNTEYKALTECAYTGLKAGFIIGYRKGLKDAKKRETSI